MPQEFRTLKLNSGGSIQAGNSKSSQFVGSSINLGLQLGRKFSVVTSFRKSLTNCLN